MVVVGVKVMVMVVVVVVSQQEVWCWTVWSGEISSHSLPGLEEKELHWTSFDTVRVQWTLYFRREILANLTVIELH